MRHAPIASKAHAILWWPWVHWRNQSVPHELLIGDFFLRYSFDIRQISISKGIARV